MDPFICYDAVYTRHFPGSNFSVSLRPLHLGRDKTLLRDWVKRKYVRPSWMRHIPYEEILRTLVHTAHSDFAQVFTGMHAGRPLCEVQVSRASQDDGLGATNLVRPGDYVLRLLPGSVEPAEHLAVIKTCVAYFLQHEEVKRLLAVVDEDDISENKVIKKAGFTRLSAIPAAYRMDNLYVYPSAALQP